MSDYKQDMCCTVTPKKFKIQGTRTGEFMVNVGTADVPYVDAI